MDTATDFVTAVSDLNGRGYTREFRIKEGQIYDLVSQNPVDIQAVHVDVSYRFEDEDDGADGSNLYAITDKNTGQKGLLIDAFDTLDQECTKELFDQLNAEREVLRSGAEPAASRYGLRKVFKSEFNQEPERYVLRIGFPDFPPCPFGNSFSVLGFDTAAQEYVWLVTNIIRDSRLTRVPYQGENAEDE